MVTAIPTAFKVTVPQCDPDMRCDSTALVDSPHGVDEPYGVDCVLEDGHHPDADPDAMVHTDGDGTWWSDSGDVEFR